MTALGEADHLSLALFGRHFEPEACLRIVGGFLLANNRPLTSADRFPDKLPRLVSPESGQHASRFKSPRPASRTSTRLSRRPEVPSRTLWFWKVDRARRRRAF